MSEKSTTERLKEICIEQLGLDGNDPNFKFTDDTTFVADLQADSLDLVELTMAIEDEFGITLEDEEAEKCETVGAAVKLIDDTVAKKSA